MTAYLIALFFVGAAGSVCGYWIGRDLEARSAYQQMVRLRRAQEVQQRSIRS